MYVDLNQKEEESLPFDEKPDCVDVEGSAVAPKTIKPGPVTIKPTATQEDVKQKEKLEKAMQVKQTLNNYLVKDQVKDFADLPTSLKLHFLQRTDKKFIRQRALTKGGVMVPYVEHEYAEKALNFVFNFNVSAELVEHTLVQKDKCVEATVIVKFKVVWPETGAVIERPVISTHKQFANPVLTDSDALKGAMSKAYTLVARTFGIGTDLEEAERQAYQKAQEIYEQPKDNTYPTKNMGGTVNSKVNLNPNYN